MTVVLRLRVAQERPEDLVLDAQYDLDDVKRLLDLAIEREEPLELLTDKGPRKIDPAEYDIVTITKDATILTRPKDVL